MIKDTYCCSNCFDNVYIKKYIDDNHEKIGDCIYCNSKAVDLISLKEMGIYLRECIEKAYESIDGGSGVYYDPDEKSYCGPDGEPAYIRSIRDIFIDEEILFSDDVVDTSLLKDLFENVYSDRDIQNGETDPFDDVDSREWVIRDDLYGFEQINMEEIVWSVILAMLFQDLGGAFTMAILPNYHLTPVERNYIISYLVIMTEFLARLASFGMLIKRNLFIMEFQRMVSRLTLSHFLYA